MKGKREFEFGERVWVLEEEPVDGATVESILPAVVIGLASKGDSRGMQFASVAVVGRDGVPFTTRRNLDRIHRSRLDLAKQLVALAAVRLDEAQKELQRLDALVASLEREEANG